METWLTLCLVTRAEQWGLITDPQGRGGIEPSAAFHYANLWYLEIHYRFSTSQFEGEGVFTLFCFLVIMKM